MLRSSSNSDFFVELIGENTWQVDPRWTTTTEGGSIASNYDEWLDTLSRDQR